MNNNFNLDSLPDEELISLQKDVYDILKKRNLERGDLDEIVDEAFNSSFPKIDGLGSNPWVDKSILICPGARIDSSVTKHKCRFVVVDEEWSWESPHQIVDTVRRDKSSKNLRQHSVTLVTPFEGMKIQVITQKCQRGQHIVETVEGYVFNNGNLEKTMVKSKASRSH